MNVPTPIENLPGFNSGMSSQPVSNTWLKFIIVVGVLLLGVAVSALVMRRAQRNTTKFNENENGKD